jgi:hypothetical protein
MDLFLASSIILEVESFLKASTFNISILFLK